MYHVDNLGRTPVWWAAKRGYSEVVKLLLEREEVNPNQADNRYGRTPLSEAAEEGFVLKIHEDSIPRR